MISGENTKGYVEVAGYNSEKSAQGKTIGIMRSDTAPSTSTACNNFQILFSGNELYFCSKDRTWRQISSTNVT
jgi:hypothetical protein